MAPSAAALVSVELGTGTISVEPSPTRGGASTARSTSTTSIGSNSSRSSCVSSAALRSGWASTSRGDAVELLEHALGGQHAAAEQLVQDPLPCARVDRERHEQRQRQRGELAEREHRDEEQVQRGRHGADRRQQRELAHQLLRARQEGHQQQQRREEHVPDHRADDAMFWWTPVATAEASATVSSSQVPRDEAEAAQHSANGWGSIS